MEHVIDVSELEGLDDLDVYETDFDDSLDHDLITRKMTEWVMKSNVPIKRGDLVSLVPRSERYRNDWVYIWDGSAVIDLEYDVDDYGHVPRSFVVTHTEFSPRWWVDLVAHNSIFWLADEIKEGMRFVRDDGERGVFYADVVIGNDTWRCFVIDSEGMSSIDVNNGIFYADGYEHMYPFEGKCFYMVIP